eukprot:9175373-Pyramimonas_sp.AAC.1
MSNRTMVSREYAAHGIARHGIASRRERDSCRQQGQRETTNGRFGKRNGKFWAKKGFGSV